MKELIYFFDPTREDCNTICEHLNENKNIKFVSLVTVDLGNNHTDEKIPISFFIEDCNQFLREGIQTDGSSVYLPQIAEINNAKVDLIPDLSVKWIVDYNWDNIDPITQLPVGTLIIPAFLRHDNKLVGSRSILKRSVSHFEQSLLSLIKKNPQIASELNISSVDDIEKIVLTVATELEFWVKTPDYTTDIEKLSTSQSLKEQYWKRTVGPVRTALEKSLTALDNFGYEPEMAHKEVGGVSAKLKRANNFSHIMEQLEIDWKYSTPLQTADNELFAKNIINDIFVKEGLEVTFKAKPIEDVAGSGEHHHLGIGAITKNGDFINLFSPSDMKSDYLNTLGYGAMMGLLHNYEIINPFVTSTNDAFNRLKPGFEAPICIVGSLGHTTEDPSRNRTVLIGLVRDVENPNATRFELRSPNPTSNSYLLTAACYQAMLDGIGYALNSKKTSKELYAELTKQEGVHSDYLIKNRQYICEENVFDNFRQEERDRLFSRPPANVFENLMLLNKNKDKLKCLDGVFTDAIINSYKATLLAKWTKELGNRLIPDGIAMVRNCKKCHLDGGNIADLDIVRWEEINKLKIYLMQDSMTHKSIFTRIKEAIEAQDYALTSKLHLEMSQKLLKLRQLYQQYKQNLFTLE